MQENRKSGYQEIVHTADLALHVWAPSLEALFEEAAGGMYTLMGVQSGGKLRCRREIRLDAGDVESLLVSFLNELLYHYEDEGIAYNHLAVKISAGYQLAATVEGAKSLRQEKEIKAVTFNDLAITQKEGRFEATVVFDV
jgi:SHS2 domain-containing protein